MTGKAVRKPTGVSAYADPPPGVLEGFAGATEFALTVIGADGNVMFLNDAALRMFGYGRDEMLGQPLDVVIPPRLRGAHRSGLSRVAAGGKARLSGRTVVVTGMRAGGQEFPLEMSLTVWRGPEGPLIGAVMRDVSHQRERDLRLHRLAHHDALTGLPNRFQCLDTLQEMLAAGRDVALILLAVHGLQRINDNLGFSTGDTLLQTLAIRLAGMLDRDGVLARTGKQSFVILLPGGDDRQASSAGAALLEALRAPFSIGEHLLNLDAGVGIAMGPRHGAEAEELLASADLALHQALQGGRRGVSVYEPMMRSAAATRRALQEDLSRAVDAGELVLHYQAQVGLDGGNILGAEALLRWNHPQRGLLLPSSFLPALESHSLALHVGCWILDEACRQVAEWRALGLSLRVAVNLFAAQVGAGNLAEVVEQCLDRHRLPPEALEIEVTETIVLANDDRVHAPFHALRERGVRVAFDDFGTGHASLSMLKRFPITTLKIDRGFVKDLLADRFDAAIIQALLSVGHSTGLDVVAEGVETKEQEAVLQALGCKIGQGFLYARPLPPSDFMKLFGQLRAGPPRQGDVPRRPGTS